MKKTLIVLITILTSINTFSQEITGPWHGALEIPGMQLRISFNITKTENGYSATMDSPDQNSKGMPMSAATFENSVLKVVLASHKIEYTGTLKKNNTISGIFKQGPNSLPLNLSRNEIEKKAAVRPQEPKTPYPYYSEEVTFVNEKENIQFSGTLTLPKKEGRFPVAILISGSGPQNRNEELAGHKPFLVLSDYLTKNGIAVLRYDDRGSHGSKGDFKTATTLDFASDVKAAVAYLQTRKEINKKKIGLIGHSEGGIIAPMVAANSKEINYIVLLAGTGIPGDELLLLQEELISRNAGSPEESIAQDLKISKGAYEIIKQAAATESLKSDLANYYKTALQVITVSDKPESMSTEEYTQLLVEGISTPWMQYFIKYNPSLILPKVKCPVLVLNGEKDIQVPAKVNLAAIKSALEKGGNKKVTTIEFPKLNHLFQECKTCSIQEYTEIEQTISPLVLEEMSKWIAAQVK
ncbi:hypothetical protein FEDK69T_20320 [Flavobacterium enshiense DK69]|uniref:Serine aminopeptidase S33 domain-containing protein n=1 Tax=Flavobacterium enshiense DK69 TaxID=1107311 RepID=V6S807_9FLAO|nr:alpha/beta fold hydrolase [Flavobacterium enshiense]ESU22771.1 hypothetical protein FEDK69T_20320 [Flavobacterium enshiense DK69]KGO95540.1 hypothetical protein Q767_09890 [Flavobacterium enshiense DK69]